MKKTINRNIEMQEDNIITNLYIQAADIYSELKEYDKHVGELNKPYTPKNAFSPNTYFLLAVSYRNRGNYEKAIQAINKLIEISKSPSPKYYFERGLSYYKLGEYNLATMDFLKVLNDLLLNPEDVRTLALSYEKLGDIQRKMGNMILAAEQGNALAQDYIEKLSSFVF
jgi:tetratricopeptide (TPR) repeat protein